MTEAQEPQDNLDQSALFKLPQTQVGISASGAVGSNLISGDVRNSTIIGTQNIYPPPPSDPSIPPSNLKLRGSENFVGRQTQLEKLDQLLEKENRSAICALAGMGGVGKTELAVQYALQYASNYPGAICWLQVRRGDIGNQIIEYGQIYLGLEIPDSLELPQQVQYCWANWRQGKTLIVFDDVVDYAAIKPYFPPNQSRFKLVLTSRDRLLTEKSRLDLDVLSLADSLELLRAILGETDSRIDEELGQAEGLCEWLGYLPLGLELVGYYLSDHSGVSLKALQERLNRKRIEAKALLRDEKAEMTAQNGVAAAFELSWEDLAQKAPEAQKMGCILSLFAPVTFDWLWVQQIYFDTDESLVSAGEALKADDKTYEQYQNSEEWQKAGITPEQFEEYLESINENFEQLENLRDEELIKRHLLEKVSDGQFKQHPLVREFFQAKLEQFEEKDEIIQKFCRVVLTPAKQVTQTPTQTDLFAISPAIAHIKETAKNFNQWCDDKDAIWPYVSLARFYQGQSAFQEAESWHNEGLKVMKGRFGQKHPDVATSLNNLAGLYRSQGKYEEAEPYYQQSLEMRRKLLGNEHPDVASSLNNLALLYKSQGKYEEAIGNYQAAIAIAQKSLGENHPNTQTIMNNFLLMLRDAPEEELFRVLPEEMHSALRELRQSD